jgi:hypothetical protein
MINWNVDLWDARENPQAPSNEIDKKDEFREIAATSLHSSRAECNGPVFRDVR